MRDQIYENALNNAGVKWEYVERVPLDQINNGKSLANQARIEEPIDNVLVADYMEAMKPPRNEEFPAIVLWRSGPRVMWQTIDGNQRRTAKQRLGMTHTDAYIVLNDDPRVIDELTWTFNDKVNGKRLSKTECLEHAVTYHARYGGTVKDVARRFGVGESTLAHRIGINRAREMLREKGRKVNPSVTDEHIKGLKGLIDLGEDLFVAAFDVTNQAGLTTTEVDDLYKEVRHAKTTEERAKVIDNFAQSDRVTERKAETKGGKTQIKPNAPREKHDRLLKEFDRLIDEYSWTALKPYSSDFKTQQKRALRVARFLVQNYGLGTLPTLQGMGEDGKEVG